MDSSWQQALDAFLLSILDRSGSVQSVNVYKNVLAHFFINRDPAGVTKADIEVFLHQPVKIVFHHGRPIMPATRNRWLSTIKSFYTFASMYVPKGATTPLYTKANPTLGIRRAKEARVYRAFDADELARFFAVIPTDTVIGCRDRALFLTYFYTARRREEIVRLRYGDITQGILSEPDGRRRIGWIYQWQGKGRAGEYRFAELPTPVKDAIDRYLQSSSRADTIRPEDPLFVPIFNGDTHLSGYAIWRRLKHYCRLAGLDTKRLDVHSLRRSAAQERYALDPEHDVLRITGILDHDSPQNTWRYLAKARVVADPIARLLEEKFRSL